MPTESTPCAQKAQTRKPTAFPVFRVWAHLPKTSKCVCDTTNQELAWQRYHEWAGAGFLVTFTQCAYGFKPWGLVATTQDPDDLPMFGITPAGRAALLDAPAGASHDSWYYDGRDNDAC